MQDSRGKITKVAPKAGDQYTFTLLRNPSKNSSNQLNLFLNNLDADELLNSIHEQKQMFQQSMQRSTDNPTMQIQTDTILTDWSNL